MSKNRITALGTSAVSAALVGSVLFAPAATAQEAPASPSAYAVKAEGLVDVSVSYVEGTGSEALVGVDVPEDSPFVSLHVAEVDTGPGFAQAKDVSLTLGSGSLAISLDGITATCDQGELSSSLFTISYMGQTHKIATSEDLKLLPAPLNRVLDITLNKTVTRSNGPNTVTAVAVTLLKGGDKLTEGIPVLDGLFGQTIRLASATCAKSDGGNNNDDNGKTDEGDKPNGDGNKDDGNKDGGDNNGGDDGDGQAADEAEEDGTAPTPVPQPGHISVTG